MLGRYDADAIIGGRVADEWHCFFFPAKKGFRSELFAAVDLLGTICYVYYYIRFEQKQTFKQNIKIIIVWSKNT